MKVHKKIERKRAFFGKRVLETLIERKKIGSFTTYACENSDFLAVLPVEKRWDYLYYRCMGKSHLETMHYIGFFS